MLLSLFIIFKKEKIFKYTKPSKHMNLKRIIGIIFQIPAWLLMIGSVLVGIYAYAKHINNIGFGVPFILSLIFVFYVVGRLMARKENSHSNLQEQKIYDSYIHQENREVVKTQPQRVRA